MSALSWPSLVGPTPRGVSSLARRTRLCRPGRSVRRAARLQDPAAADLIDIPREEQEESSSNSSSVDAVVISPPSTSVSSSSSSQQEQQQQLVSSLLALAAATDRGAGGTRRERAAVESLASRLERTTRRKHSASKESLLVGRWSLVYSSVQPFRSSPFFWGFSKALGSVAAAEAVFAFTDALPFARVGSARQEVTSRKESENDDDDESFWITSDVGLTVAGASGRVVTEASATLTERNDENGLFSLSVRPVSTRVEGSALLRGLGPLGELAVPVGEALDSVASFTSRNLRGGDPPGSDSSSDSSCATDLEITYLDDTLRIGRTSRDGHLFVYARDEE